MNTDGNLKEAENNIEGQLQKWPYLIFVAVSGVCSVFQIFPELKVLAKICQQIVTTILAIIIKMKFLCKEL